MRIMFVCDHFPTYGTKSVLTLASTLASRGHDLLIASTSVGLNGEVLTNSNEWGFHVARFGSLSVPRTPYSYTPFAKTHLSSLAKKFEPDVVHTHFLMYWLGLNSSFLASSGFPLLLTLHGFTLPTEHLDWPSGLALDFLYQTMGTKLVSSVSKVICVSEQVQEKFQMVYHKYHHQSCVIPIGVNPSTLSLSAVRKRDEVRSAMGLVDKRVFIFLGRVVKEKGVFEIIRAFYQLRREREDVALLIVGDGNILPQLSRMTQHIPDIHFVGFQRDIGSFLSASDVFVLPSYREGLSTSLIESMFFRLPFIVTPTGGTSDIVRMGGRGIIVPIGCLSELHNAMLRMATMDSGELRGMGEANREVVLRELTWERITDKLMGIYLNAQ